MPNAVQLDVLVLGGGIAGLWTLDRLSRCGFSAGLIERQSLGAGQSGVAQGILHTGGKYPTRARQGLATLAACGPRWRAALSGAPHAGDPDLRDVRVLSEHTHVACTGRLAAALVRHGGAGVQVGSRELRRCALAAFPGAVLRMDEPVIDVHALLRTLAAPWCARTVAGGPEPPLPEPDGRGGYQLTLRSRERDTRIHARAVVLAAGAGNPEAARGLGVQASTWRRPLHQVIVQHPDAPPLWAHLLAAPRLHRPRVTVTSHPDGHGGWVWYVGGGLAEQGVGRDRNAQLDAAGALLRRLVPGLDLRRARLDTLRAERAEPATRGTRRLEPRVERHGAVLVCWPLKLALAPALGDRVLAALAAAGIAPSGADPTEALAHLPRPAATRPPWAAAR